MGILMERETTSRARCEEGRGEGFRRRVDEGVRR